MRYQPIFDIAELCVRKGIRDVVLSPGSRCAPLTLAFTRNKSIRTRTFSDERSAGFIGLGMAQQKKRATVLLCTSGTAAYNFAPAIAEAFFSQVPLIVFTADRPSEWIAQHDGQTIFQGEIYGRHVKGSFTLPQDYDSPDSIWAVNRLVNEAINLAQAEPRGPVHINAPFREPLYPEKNESTRFSDDVRVMEEISAEIVLTADARTRIEKEFPLYKKVLIVAGQEDPDKELFELAEKISGDFNIPIVSDIISNLGTRSAIVHTDLFLGQATEEVRKDLRPDLLISFGKSLISKNLKLFLRKYPAMQHWHIQSAGPAADTFKNLTHIFHSHPSDFLRFLHTFTRHSKNPSYFEAWRNEEKRTVKTLDDFFSRQELTELEAVKVVMDHLPHDANLHLANSMSVRYANIIGLEKTEKSIHVFSNRGTSGIDGCTSTAAGHALSNEKLNVLITGDVAFFYDRNAFWHNYPLPNLRVLLLNNHGGLIFNMIDGPASQPESGEYFVTRQELKAANLCEDFGFAYIKPESRRELDSAVKKFFEDQGRTQVMEVETDVHLSRTVFDKLKKKIKSNYEL